MVLAVPPVAAAQTQRPPTQTQSQTQAPPPDPPDNLPRIREAVNRPSTLKIENGQLRIYVKVIADWPTFADITKGYDLKNGPTGRGNPMSHREFLNMVTPKEMYSTAGIQPAEMLEWALVGYLGSALIKKGLEEIRKARSEREVAEIRARIDRELAALRGGDKNN